MSSSATLAFLDLLSTSLSANETMAALNNAHNGFMRNIHRVATEQFIQPSFHNASGPVFLNSGQILVYPRSNGVLDVWVNKSRMLAGSVHSTLIISARRLHPDREFQMVKLLRSDRFGSTC